MTQSLYNRCNIAAKFATLVIRQAALCYIKVVCTMQALRRFGRRHPIVTNMGIYGVLYSGAEFFQQTFNRKVEEAKGSVPAPYDTDVLKRYAIMGTFVFPQVLYHVYKYLDNRYVGKTMTIALKKLAVDALLVTPFNISLFYIGMSLMEGKKDVLEEWRTKIIPTFLTGTVFWVPANLINFRFLPPQFRVVYVGSCQVIWVSILCWFKRQEY